MRKTLKLLTLTGAASLIAWTTVSAQFDSLPDGLPQGDIVSLGDNLFSSDLLGDFKLDTSIENRVIHTILGPMVWEWEEEKELVILHTEWWGTLRTHLPTVSEEKMHASGLGFTWPLLKSELTGATYYIEVKTDTTDPLATPFFNHRIVNGDKVGWQRSIGIDLSNAENYYQAAETIVGQMQDTLQLMVNTQQEFVNLPVSLSSGQGPIDEKFSQVNAQFLNMHEQWVNFIFYYHRASLAPMWAEKEGKPQVAIDMANAYGRHLPGLETTALAVYGNCQEILNVNCTGLKDQKTNQLNTLVAEEAARKAAEEAAKKVAAAGGSGGPSGSGGTPVTPPLSGGGTTTPIVVEGDAINWNNVDQVGGAANLGVEGFNKGAQLASVVPHLGQYYSPHTEWYLRIGITGTSGWRHYLPYGIGNPIAGNIWIFVPQGVGGVSGTQGRYWAAVFEGYGAHAINFPAGNLNFHDKKLLNNTPLQYPWLPQSGVQYGWMVSNNLIYPGRNGSERSNIIIQAWP